MAQHMNNHGNHSNFPAHRSGRGRLVAALTASAAALTVPVVAAATLRAGSIRELPGPAPVVAETDVGSDPFADDVSVPLPDTTTLEVVEPRSAQGVGLYGGTGTNACDTVALVNFLDAHPGKALAFATVHRIRPIEIRSYVDTLTAGWLADEVVVTNHGYRSGVPVARVETLLAGTAVLVDSDGITRVRCKCGNPTTVALVDTVDYVDSVDYVEPDQNVDVDVDVHVDAQATPTPAPAKTVEETKTETGKDEDRTTAGGTTTDKSDETTTTDKSDETTTDDRSDYRPNADAFIEKANHFKWTFNEWRDKTAPQNIKASSARSTSASYLSAMKNDLAQMRSIVGQVESGFADLADHIVTADEAQLDRAESYLNALVANDDASPPSKALITAHERLNNSTSQQQKAVAAWNAAAKKASQ